MEPHQERVIVEKVEIDDRVQKLALFIAGDVFAEKVDRAERQRLVDQLYHMRRYALILGDRIAAFPRPTV